MALFFQDVEILLKMATEFEITTWKMGLEIKCQKNRIEIGETNFQLRSLRKENNLRRG